MRNKFEGVKYRTAITGFNYNEKDFENKKIKNYK